MHTYQNWPTRDTDLTAAFKIIAKHIDFNDGEPLGMLSVNVTEETIVDCEIADWVIELYDFFNEKYGHEDGIEITQKVVSTCLIENETLH